MAIAVASEFLRVLSSAWITEEAAQDVHPPEPRTVLTSGLAFSRLNTLVGPHGGGQRRDRRSSSSASHFVDPVDDINIAPQLHDRVASSDVEMQEASTVCSGRTTQELDWEWLAQMGVHGGPEHAATLGSMGNPVDSIPTTMARCARRDHAGITMSRCKEIKPDPVEVAMAVQLAYTAEQVSKGHTALPRFIVLPPQFSEHLSFVWSVYANAKGVSLRRPGHDRPVTTTHRNDRRAETFGTLDHLEVFLEEGGIPARELAAGQRTGWHYWRSCCCTACHEYVVPTCGVFIGFVGLLVGIVTCVFYLNKYMFS